MIVCPSCLHQNPDGAVQCEACYTSLPTTMSCQNCGASVQSDASFCGQCGFDLRQLATVEPQQTSNLGTSIAVNAVEIPNLAPLDPLIIPELPALEPLAAHAGGSELDSDPVTAAQAVIPPPPMYRQSKSGNPATQLQQKVARLMHMQTNTLLELPLSLTVIHLGKPNDRIPPDVDVAGFPNSEVVSRIHADIRVEGDAFFIEDVGSANGTYINNLPLPPGNRHRLRAGDRIALGKGDLVTFLFQLS